MSRSNPNANAPNPATRWFEWSGETGSIRYYDKELKENIICPLPFTFLLLDELSSVRGWHEASKSGITSNQVRDTREELMVVRAFKAGTLAEGLYKDIKDRIARVGGKFVTNCYLGFKRTTNHERLEIGCLQLKGAALRSWMDFRKDHRRELFEQAVVITGSTEGKKGRIVYKMPTFQLYELSPATNSEAIVLDKTLQAYLTEYLSRATHDRVEPEDTGTEQDIEEDNDNTPIPDNDSDIPFLTMPVLKLHDCIAVIKYVKETTTRGGLRRFEIGAENVVGDTLADRVIGLTTLDQWKASLCSQAIGSKARLHIKYRETPYFDAALLFVEPETGPAMAMQMEQER